MGQKRKSGQTRRARKMKEAIQRREQKRVIKKYRNGKNFLDQFCNTLPGLIETFQSLDRDFHCKQLQCIIMDLQSIEEHLISLAEDGPKEPMKEIPLEDSELPIQPHDIPGGTLDQGSEETEAQTVEGSLE